jgi:pimeloyl-ACP methyl ester carboxylesterase
MGGWIGLLLARARPERVAGFVGIAAAPDFTEDVFWEGARPQDRDALLQKGVVWAEEPAGHKFPITRRLIEDGRAHLLLRGPLPLLAPAHLFHGSEDSEVPQATALRLLAQITAPACQLTLIEGGDHRLSRPEDLAQIWSAALALSRAAAA